MKTCKFTGCSRPSRTRDWCHTHYAQFQRGGEAAMKPIRKPAPKLVTISVRVEPSVARALRAQAKAAGVTSYALASAMVSSATNSQSSS